jgi:glycerophosphoryl diester phosphodiesterase
MGIDVTRSAVLGDRREKPLIAAHRGASHAAAENSLVAVERAIEFGSDMVEIDVRRTRDGILIAHHDPVVGDESISSLTYADVTDAKGHALATIDAIVGLAAGRTLLDIELKEDGYEAEVVDLLNRRMAADEFIVTSFLERALVAAKRLGVRTGLLCKDPLGADDIFAAVKRTGADIVAPHCDLAQEDVLQGAADRKLPVLVWTVNESVAMKRYLADRRIGGVITDEPDVAVAVRRDGNRRDDYHEYEPAA